MKVAFIYPQWTGGYGVFGHFAKRQSRFPPLNLALLAAITQQIGYEAVIIDAEAEELEESELVKRTLNLKPDLIGLTCYSPFFHLNVSVAKALKDAGCKAPICVGGPHITIMKEKILEEYPEFDYLFIGESEETLPKFLDVYQAGGDLTQVKGIILRKEGRPYIGEPQWVPATIKLKGDKAKPLGDALDPRYPLDQFPLPARNLLPMKMYRMGTKHGRPYFTSIQQMRGCPWHCIFCASGKLNTTRMSTRSPRSIVDEMKKVITDFPFISHFYIVDDVMTLWESDHILKVCELILQEGLKITFEGSTRANLIKDESVALMAKAGLVRICFGLETTNTQMRETMRKQVNLDDYSKANAICNKYGVEAINATMIGLPGETRETVKATLDWLAESRSITQANFAIAVPYPGTEFSDMGIQGTHGVELIAKEGDFSKYLRYGSAVTKIGELSPEDLLELQNEAFINFYSKWWRWKAMFQKHGIMGFTLLGIRIYRAWKGKLLKKFKPVYNHPKDF